MTVGILGSGFGLYGYLPALIARLGKHVVLPERYRQKVLDRPDVREFAPDVEWASSDEELLGSVSELIICRRPADQVTLALSAARRLNLSRLLLEKPLAPSPAEAAHLLQVLEASGKFVSVGYNFRFTQWGEALKSWSRRAGENASLVLRWHFLAHHYANDIQSWKRKPSEGGGALRFYGIHLVGLLSELGYDKVEWSRVDAMRHDRANDEWSRVPPLKPDEAHSWQAAFCGPGLPTFQIDVGTRSGQKSFLLDGRSPLGEPFNVQLNDPFEEAPRYGFLDGRVDILARICRDFLLNDGPTPSWYAESVALWKKVEEQNLTVLE